jgi:signal transduction histidine kinase
VTNGFLGRLSIKTKFQAAFIVLALAAVGVTGYVALVGASRALQEATYDRLTAIRETRRHALERYFQDLGNHVVALSTSETAALALDELNRSWQRLTPAPVGAPIPERLQRYYAETLAPRLTREVDRPSFLRTWLPDDPRVRWVQQQAIAENPHPTGSKDLLVEIPGTGDYGEAHARHHPTFHRYQSAFGFYDIFLISAPEGRILYTVLKEIDLGADLTREPYRSTRLGQLYARAMAASSSGADATFVIEDFAPYAPSAFAPAAFIGAPIRVAGATVGVLAMQISIREVDRVMTGEQQWQEEGLGRTGQAYAVGSDNTLRSDLRPFIEDPEAFYQSLSRASTPSSTIETIRNNRTAVLTLPVDLRVVQGIRSGEGGTELGVNLLDTPVLRSHAPLAIRDLQWAVVAEVDADEAFAPVRAVQVRILVVGLGVGALFLVAGTWLGASITEPVLALSRSVAALGSGARGTTVDVRSADEIGDLAAAFNRMSRDLERTTVSKAELEVLAGRLISAQEDERRRVARELHDDLVQRLAAAAIDLGQLEHLPEGSADRASGLQRLKRTLATLSEDVHRLSRRIHPAMLEELGLAASLEAECRAFMERGGPPVDTAFDGTFDDVAKEPQLAVYRIAQESLRNILVHSGATEVSLSLRRSPGALALEVVDNGAGFTRAGRGWTPGLGLASMEERARLLGGTLTVASAPGEGTRVTLVLPAEAGVPNGDRR